MTAVIRPISRNAHTSSITAVAVRNAANAAYENGVSVRVPSGAVIVVPAVLDITSFGPDTHPSTRSRPGSRTGRGFHITVSARLKMAALAPMPRAIVSTATHVKTGARRSVRSV